MKRVSGAAAPRLSAGAPSAVRPPQPAISKGASAAPGKGTVKAGAGLCKGKRGGKTISTAKMSDSYVVSFPTRCP
uniref:Histone lysine acetyltransferase MYST-A n=1 Tax=Toxoplasma gondii COUG TaxID=1074873 RepID=A0A2G8XR68_TOXGO|nr:histone lysine acetyltransferase MYST-A [Toxoplasma gondii COUG]